MHLNLFIINFDWCLIMKKKIICALCVALVTILLLGLLQALLVPKYIENPESPSPTLVNAHLNGVETVTSAERI